MTSRRKRLLLALLAATCLGISVVGAGGEDVAKQTNPLQAFERLIGARWELEGSYQEFEWGLGGRSVVSRSYFVTDGKPRRVAEGFWYWHPGEKVLRGVFVAIDMPVVLFDYTTRFDGERMVSDLRSYAEDGEESVYQEIFEFTADDRYEWTLLADSPDGMQRVMGGTYTRK